MLILNTDYGKTMKISLKNEMTKTVDTELTRIVYIPELPTVITTSEKDAKEIQKQVNEFVNNLSQYLIKH